MFARKQSSNPNRFARVRGFFSAHFSTRTRSDSTERDNLNDLMRQHDLSEAQAAAELEGLGPRDGALLVECYEDGLRAKHIRVVRHNVEYATQLLCDIVRKDDALNRYFTVLLKAELKQSDDKQAALASALDACSNLDHDDEDRIVYLHKMIDYGIRDKHLSLLDAAASNSSSHIKDLAAQYLTQADGLTPLAAFQLLDSDKPHFSEALVYLVLENEMTVTAAKVHLASKSDDELINMIPKVSVPSPN